MHKISDHNYSLNSPSNYNEDEVGSFKPNALKISLWVLVNSVSFCFPLLNCISRSFLKFAIKFIQRIRTIYFLLIHNLSDIGSYDERNKSYEYAAFHRLILQQPVMFFCGTFFVIVDMEICPPAAYGMYAGYCMNAPIPHKDTALHFQGRNALRR